MHTIYTAGYGAGWTPATLRDEVLRLGAVLWDIRYRPHSRRVEWERAALRAQFDPGQYAHEPALGNPNYQGGPIALAAPDRAVPAARRLLARCPIVLLCACANARTCHRSVAAAYLAREIGCTRVVHLDPPVAPGAGGLLGLSLNPPWGTLIALAARRPELGKRIETRDWQRSYRGPMAIHQTKGLGELASEAELAALCGREPFASALAAAGVASPGQLPRGQIVAVVRLAEIRPTSGERGPLGGPTYADWVHDLSPRERAFGNYAPGRFGWVLADIQALAEPVPCRGAQGLWPVPADVAAAVTTQLPGVG
jgi:hypothetical protein